MCPSNSKLAGTWRQLRFFQVLSFKSEPLAGFKSEWVAEFRRNPQGRGAHRRLPTPMLLLAHGYEGVNLQQDALWLNRDFRARLRESAEEHRLRGLALPPERSA
jgi:hypothetical protein